MKSTQKSIPCSQYARDLSETDCLSLICTAYVCELIPGKSIAPNPFPTIKKRKTLQSGKLGKPTELEQAQGRVPKQSLTSELKKAKKPKKGINQKNKQKFQWCECRGLKRERPCATPGVPHQSRRRIQILAWEAQIPLAGKHPPR